MFIEAYVFLFFLFFAPLSASALNACVCVCVCVCVCTARLLKHVHVRRRLSAVCLFVPVCVCVCVCIYTVAVACWSPSQPFPYRASSELTDRSSGRAETTSHTTHRESEAIIPRVTSRTYLLIGEQGPDRRYT